MTLLWLQVRLCFRRLLGIRDVTAIGLQSEIERRERARLRRGLTLRLIGRCLLIAALAVIFWVALTR